MSAAIGVGCCWLVAVVFAISAAGKLRTGAARTAFRRSVRDMAVLPAGAVGPAAVAVPILEVVAVLLLVVPATAVLGCVVALALLAAFTTGIAVVLHRRTPASCRCFGTSKRPYGARHLTRNTFLGIVTLAGALLSGVPVEVPAMLISVAAGAVGAVLVVVFDEMLDLFGTPVR